MMFSVAHYISLFLWNTSSSLLNCWP